jgi:geranylgeranyl pyrophosphate synthase
MNVLNISENTSLALKEVELGLKGKFDWKFSSPELKGSTFHLLDFSGKMLRPTLVFIGAEAVGLNSMKYVDLAVAIEYLHISSLIHDDIVDHDTVRRGTDAVHVKYGLENALLAGDALIARAVFTSSPYGEGVMRRISETAFVMCDGESLDYGVQNKSVSINLKNYMIIAEKKTASLISTSLSIAAIHEKICQSAVEKLSSAGEDLGIAFQVRDDIINSIGSVELGKRPGKDDIKFNRPNIVSVLQLEGKERREATEAAIDLMSNYVSKALKKLSEFEKTDSIRKTIMTYFDSSELRKYL